MAEQLATAWTCRGVCSCSRPHSKWPLCFNPKALHCNSPKVAYKGCKEHIYHWHCKDHWICWTMGLPCQSCSAALSCCKTLCCSGPNSKIEAVGPLDKRTQAEHNNEDYKYVASKIQKCWALFLVLGRGRCNHLFFTLEGICSMPPHHWTAGNFTDLEGPWNFWILFSIFAISTGVASSCWLGPINKILLL